MYNTQTINISHGEAKLSTLTVDAWYQIVPWTKNTEKGNGCNIVQPSLTVNNSIGLSVIRRELGQSMKSRANIHQVHRRHELLKQIHWCRRFQALSSIDVLTRSRIWNRACAHDPKCEGRKAACRHIRRDIMSWQIRWGKKGRESRVHTRIKLQGKEAFSGDGICMIDGLPVSACQGYGYRSEETLVTILFHLNVCSTLQCIRSGL